MDENCCATGKKHTTFKSGSRRDEEMVEDEKGLLVQVQCIHAGAWTMTWAESFHGLRWGTRGNATREDATTGAKISQGRASRPCLA